MFIPDSRVCEKKFPVSNVFYINFGGIYFFGIPGVPDYFIYPSTYSF